MPSTMSSLPAEWLRFAPPARKLEGNDRWNVFLSYRSVNRPWVLNLYDVLRQAGHAVFLDQLVLKPSDPLTRRLEDALVSSQAGVLIWSKFTADSEWVRSEYDALIRLSKEKKGFQFVPVALDGTKLPAFAANLIYLDFSSYPDGPNGGELLRLLHALAGEPLSREAADFALQQDEESQIAAVKIRAAVRNGYPERVLQLAKEGGLPWEVSPALGCLAADGFTKLKRNDDALALLDELRKRFPRAIRPQQLYALALARRGKPGDLEQAQEILGALYEQGERDPETLGIYGRTWMDRYAEYGDVKHLRRSRDLYAEAFERAPDDYYTGINAAAKNVFLGTPEDLKSADDYAAKVQKVVGVEAKAGDYWWTATVGELHLIRKHYDAAARVYKAAIAIAPEETASHETTWKQACRLMEILNPTPEERAQLRSVFEHLPNCGEINKRR
jgi:tetratricopeptide (TPR) repeat protein